jgi:hypothetical protein
MNLNTHIQAIFAIALCGIAIIAALQHQWAYVGTFATGAFALLRGEVFTKKEE